MSVRDLHPTAPESEELIQRCLDAVDSGDQVSIAEATAELDEYMNNLIQARKCPCCRLSVRPHVDGLLCELCDHLWVQAPGFHVTWRALPGPVASAARSGSRDGAEQPSTETPAPQVPSGKDAGHEQ